MARGKYIKDYTIENQYNPRTGKTKKISKYTGPYFSFTDIEKVKKGKTLFLILSILSTVSFFVMMFVNAPCGHAFYVMVPLVISLIFYFYLWASMLRLFTAKDKVTREHKDKIGARFKMASMAILILTSVSFVGHIVYDILYFKLLNFTNRIFEILFYVMMAVILATAFLMFKKASDFEMQELKSIDPEEEKSDSVSK